MQCLRRYSTDTHSLFDQDRRGVQHIIKKKKIFTNLSLLKKNKTKIIRYNKLCVRLISSFLQQPP